MNEIPITITHHGREYHGQLNPVHGGGAAVFHLMIDNYYYGRLRYANGWVFDTNAGSVGWEYLAEEMGYVVTAWKDAEKKRAW